MPGCLLSGPSCHKGIPARAWPTTLARFASRAFVARSEEVIPPYYSIDMYINITLVLNGYVSLSVFPPYTGNTATSTLQTTMLKRPSF